MHARVHIGDAGRVQVQAENVRLAAGAAALVQGALPGAAAQRHARRAHAGRAHAARHVRLPHARRAHARLPHARAHARARLHQHALHTLRPDPLHDSVRRHPAPARLPPAARSHETPLARGGPGRLHGAGRLAEGGRGLGTTRSFVA